MKKTIRKKSTNKAKHAKSQSKEQKSGYNPSLIEPKWQAIWEKEGIYQPDLNSAKRPFYNLMMFPYPSAEGLHIGGVRTFGGVDIYGRFKRMQGMDTFQPFGLDGFGIHAENYALKIGEHPLRLSKITEENFYRQIREAGLGVDWSRTVETYKPEYYKWTQWLFVQLFKKGLAYRKKSPVNFCPSCKTVLADEQVIDGKCERCSSLVEKRNLEQWFFRITRYADRLLKNIEGLDWTEKVKIAQRNWIGRKEGINITYNVENSKHEIVVFTTRPDTNFGATFIALAPEHPLAQKLATKENKQKVEAYIKESVMKSEVERQAEGRDKTGVFTGAYAINQLTGYRMSIWISDFVLTGFGTGALVGVPGHDKRDFEFATKFGLEVIRVVVGKDGDTTPITHINQVQEEEGIMINSEFLDGLNIHEATEKIMDYMEEKGYGKRETTYHLRDWLISRQRYWGPPIPMIYCEKCGTEGKSWFSSTVLSKSSRLPKSLMNDWDSAGWYPVPEEDLPVKLPFLENYKPLGTGKSPLASDPEFVKTTCPGCGSQAKRETDVSDTFLDSAWYFFRYISTEFNDRAFHKKRAKKWLPVTMYIGGAEHSVLHLLYARFITMVFHDLGYIEFEEPFARFYAHGLIIKDGAKMSKSKGNIVTPDKYVRKFGADTLRTYLHFLAPFDQEGDFRDSGIEGMYRFLKRVWKLFADETLIKTPRDADKGVNQRLDQQRSAFMHKTIKGITEDLEHLRYNTAIAKLMTWYNFLAKQESVSREEAEGYLKLLAPFAPHLAEELFQERRKEKGERRNKKELSILNSQLSIHTQPWPRYDVKYIQEEFVSIPIQVNGRLRGMFQVLVDEISDRKKIEERAKNDEKASRFLGGTIKKVIYIPGKVINFVTS